MIREAAPANGNHIVCYCDDCQSFAYFLDADAPILDAHGGSEIYQIAPARLAITDGADRLCCVRLRPGGLLRWYTDCCRTPIGNTMASRQVPFVGVICRCADPGMRTLDAVIGPIRDRVNARFATGDRSQLQAHDRAPVSMIFRAIGSLLGSRLRGQHAPSAFFDPETGAPRAIPRVLAPEELAAIEARHAAR